MQQYSLIEITTKDDLIHQGLYAEPKKKTEVALLWVHGLSGAFYKNVDLMDAYVDICKKNGWGFATCNTRGHDGIASIRKIDPSKDTGYGHVAGGAGQERFVDSIYDIDAGISFLEEKGYREIVLIGHSTGANKVCYYAGTKQDTRVKAVVLTGPMSDRLDAHLPWYALPMMKMLRVLGKGNMPIGGQVFFPITPDRFLSLYTPYTPEDVFDYGDPSPRLTVFSQIRYPMFVVFGERDEHADRPIEEIRRVFDRYETSQIYKSITLKDAQHSFGGHEKELTREIQRFISSV